jgi:hypothetical protein
VKVDAKTKVLLEEYKASKKEKKKAGSEKVCGLIST